MEGWRVESVRSVRAFPEEAAQNPGTGKALKFAYESLRAPASPAAPLAAAVAATNDGVDRISLLPVQILRNVLSRLPAKDAARTGVLALRWRGLWRTAPLVFVDAHLLPEGRVNPSWRPGLEDSLGVTNAVSDVLAKHPGPFRCVHITCCYLDLNWDKIESWLQLVADKGVQELAFINRPWPLDLPLPATLFSCTSLTSLHIGAWKFPDTADLPRAAAFPHLRELFLSLMVMKDGDLAFLLDRSPVLEVLTIIASQTDVRLSLVSHSLRCLQVVMSSLGDISVVDAPCLERLFLLDTKGRRIGGKKWTKIKIGNAPKLHMLGCWQPGQRELEIGNIIIEARTKVGPSTIVPSIKILALAVQLEARDKVKAVPSFLKCFPNVETLHIYSMKGDKATGKVNLKLWLEACPIECVQCHVKKLVIHGFQGNRSEHVFINFIAERAQALENVVIVLSLESFAATNNMDAKMKPLTTVKWASKAIKKINIMIPRGHDTWSSRIATDFSCIDPFDLALKLN